VIDWRKRHRVPLALLLGWLTWLSLMSIIGLAVLNLIDGYWLRIAWAFAVALATFALPLLLLRRLGGRQVGQLGRTR
jgi:hypothetical protein